MEKLASDFDENALEEEKVGLQSDVYNKDRIQICCLSFMCDNRNLFDMN